MSHWVMWSEINILSLIFSERGLDVQIIELKFTKLHTQEHTVSGRVESGNFVIYSNSEAFFSASCHAQLSMCK